MNHFLVFLVLASFVEDAYAYLDPGTGSLFFQSAIASIAGGIYLIKSYWHLLKAKFNFKKTKSDIKISVAASVIPLESDEPDEMLELENNNTLTAEHQEQSRTNKTEKGIAHEEISKGFFS